MQKKQVVYLSILTLLFSFVLPFLAIAPIVYFILLRNKFIDWILFLTVFCLILFVIFALNWFNSSSTFSMMLLNYSYTLLQYFLLPFLFSFIYYIFLLVYKRYGSSLLIFIIVTAIPFAILIVVSLIILKSKGFSFLQITPALDQLLKDNSSELNLKEFFNNIINYEIPKAISVISIGISLLIEQQLVSFMKKNEELKQIIKPLESTRLSKGFSWVTIVAIYSLLILKFILKINNFLLELILYNIFYLLTTLHFINGIGVIAYYFDKKLKPILDVQLLPQLKTRPITMLLVIMTMFVIVLILLPFLIYIYFAIAFLSVIDTIYPLRKERII